MPHQLPTAADLIAAHEDEAPLPSVRVPGDEAFVYATTVHQDLGEPYMTIETRTSRSRLVVHAGDIAAAIIAIGGPAIDLHATCREALRLAQEPVQIGTAAGDVLLERARHPSLGWTAEHDDAHGVAHLADLAFRHLPDYGTPPTRGSLVKAAALLLAAIDVHDRAKATQPTGVLTEAQVDALAAASWTRQAGTSGVQLGAEEWHDRHRRFVRADLLAAGIEIVEAPRG